MGIKNVAKRCEAYKRIGSSCTADMVRECFEGFVKPDDPTKEPEFGDYLKGYRKGHKDGVDWMIFNLKVLIEKESV